MGNIKFKLQVLCLALLLPAMMIAQTVRYVRTDGSDSKDGTSWANAKKTVQAAINSLSDNGLTGEVWIAKGTYKPTRSTEASSTSNLYSSFIIPSGIKVYGGFAGTETAKTQRATKTTSIGTFFSNETILSGNLSSKLIAFSVNTTKKEWNVTTYGNSYHVVWFATNGFTTAGRAKAITGEALLDGCVIEGGYAGNTIVSGHPHNAYGGGAYMVDGSKISNCVFRKCSASRNGGAIYMDGGGDVDNVYVWMSQSVGIGKSFGYGGGICVDGKGTVLHSAVMKCAARIGGGIAFMYDSSVSSDKFGMAAAATLVNNNISHTEAGGIYMNGGGVLDNVTVVQNQCSGSGANENGLLTSRSGGVYIRDHARIYNSVLWGNSCGANKHVQYANSRSSSSIEKPILNFVSLSNSDYVDWSNTVKNNIVSLSTSNEAVDQDLPCPRFTTLASGPGFGGSNDLVSSTNYKPMANSPLCRAGLQLVDIDTKNEVHAINNPSDIVGVAYNSRSTIGAYAADAQQIVATANKEIFVDPSSTTATAKGGTSWDNPALSLADAINAAQSGYKIYVKEGTVTNTQSAKGTHVRLLSINMKSGVTVLGGFSEELTGTDISERNPIEYPTVITGNVTSDYNYNVMHLVKFEGVTNAVLDGFQLRYANSKSYTFGKSSDRNGGAFLFKNSTGIVVKNCLIAGCSGVKGAAIYATGNSSVSFENYIIHNNETSSYTSTMYGVVQVDAGSTLQMNHGDIIRNAGYAIVNAGTVKLDNSVVYANMRGQYSDTNKKKSYGLNAITGKGAFSGTNNLFDEKTTTYIAQFTNSEASLSFEPDNSNYPRFVNSTQNSGVSQTGDVTYYGRTTSWEPLNTNPMTNTAFADGDHALWGTDMSVVTTRDFGGLPDIGAVENHYSNQEDAGDLANAKGQPAYGSVYYVRDYRKEDGTIDYAAGGNGMSWATAINGNAYYYDAEAHGESEQGGVGEGVWSATNANIPNETVMFRSGTSYLKYNGSGFTLTSSIKDATNFKVTQSGTGYTIKALYDTNGDGKEEEVNIGYDPDTHALSFNNSSVWNYLGNNSSGSFYFEYDTKEECLVIKCPNCTDGNIYTYSACTDCVAGELSREENCTACGGDGKVDVDIACYACGGDGKIEKGECPVCKGDKNVMCTTCLGNGEVNCYNCNGVGKVQGKCTNCDGLGYISNGWAKWDCWICDKTGIATYDCSVCHNLKKLNCTDCGGTNNIVKRGVGYTNNGSKGAGTISCIACNGSGKLNNATSCAVCGGDGQVALKACATCYGAGRFVCTSCNGLGYTNTKRYSQNCRQGCSACGGKGYWWSKNWSENYTQGTGYIMCSTCNGNAVTPNVADCTTCGGDGTVTVKYDCPACDGGTVTTTTTCTTCGGTGNCTICDGTGFHTVTHREYLIPTGLSETGTTFTYQKKKVTYDTVVQGTIGLQFAVNSAYNDMAPSFEYVVETYNEKWRAGTANNIQHKYYHFTPTEDNPEVSVWVAAGEYTSKTGYEVRNHVKVYGGFPKTGTPGMDARHPQLAEGIALSAKNQKLGLKISDYETIIQSNTSTTERDKKTNKNGVLNQPRESQVTKGDKEDIPASRVVYEGSEWDGFTIRNGYKVGLTSGGNGARGGGAGVSIYENTIIRNCIIRDNLLADGLRQRGGGVYCDGGSIINCYILNNESRSTASDNYGGGIYMIKGTLYNSVIAGNKLASSTTALGSGIFIESADFYNNTIVNNTGGASTIGVWTASGADAHLTMYNTIAMSGNQKVISVQGSTNVAFDHCFLNTESNNNPVSGTVTAKNSTINYNKKSADVNPFAETYANAIANFDFRITQKTNYNCVNEGTDGLGKVHDYVRAKEFDENVTLPDDDMDYTDRIKDCTVDIGAYEFNGAYLIKPDETTEPGKAVFYVTPGSHKMASANDPDNAACADKLQLVLDAAGRYKYDNPAKQVIVKLAHGVNDKTDKTDYYANRAVNADTESAREWSILVPHGVELWGGYNATVSGTWSNDNNGFYDTSKKETRDVTGNPTYLDSHYYNKNEDAEAITYHVVTFTNNLYDTDGELIEGKSLADIEDRAVVDGLFIKGGQADGMSMGSSVKNINEYGGAAIVTDYAHVRNCILQNNYANYGGALALTHKALVSGCLIDQNKANYGGGVYVFANRSNLSDKTMVITVPDEGKALDANMPHIYTSTIVNNKADKLGGGLWYGDDINVRVNSSVIWQNSSADQANVAGVCEISKPSDSTIDDVIYYPFAYSALQEIKADGKDNISVGPKNTSGTRFARYEDGKEQNAMAEEGAGDSKFDEFGYYGLFRTSRLCVNGMPLDDYNALVASNALSQTDFMNVRRDQSTNHTRDKVEIGARALDDKNQPKDVMLRLFVVEEGALDSELAMQMSNQTKSTYYTQQGSSFAYPFEGLKAALDYVVSARKTNTTDKANNMPFEICVAGGTYEVTGGRASSFNIPEGVSIYGGFKYDPKATSFYGRYNKPDTDKTTVMATSAKQSVPALVTDNVTGLGDDADIDLILGLQFKNEDIETMLAAREREDVNGNNIIEPWEFTNTTIISGKKANAYHVLAASRNTSVVGTAPTASVGHASAESATFYTPKYVEGQFDRYEGQPIVIDGVTVTGGNATGYSSGTLTGVSKNYYYQGGGLVVDGNHVGTAYNHTSVPMAVGFYDIPVTVANCRFEGNTAGYGGAISSNGTVNIFGSVFENNKAVAKSETADGTSVSYAGQGGAIYATHQLSAYNTVFANNEALDATYSITPTAYKFVGQNSTAQTVGGVGGAIFVGKYGNFHIANCDIVRNQANAYPAVYTMNPETTTGVNAVSSSYNDTYHNQLINTVAWGNEVNASMAKKFASNAYFKFASNLICNYGSPTRNTSDYNPAFVSGAAPKSQTELDNAANFAETAWFCAYENGRGVTPNNKKDLREVDYNPLMSMATLYSQNSNIIISSENGAYDGPNFASPSDKAGTEGYREGWDWSRARISDLTDNGSGVIAQTVEIAADGYSMRYDNYGNSGQDKPAERDSYATVDNDDYVVTGFYPMKHFVLANSATATATYKRYLPLGDEFFMQTAYPVEGEDQMAMNRICYNPSPAHKLAYIDIGAYEYFYVPFNETDILYVSTKENTDNGAPDGSTWDRPTSDLQRAMETLLSSRNGHKKEIRLLEGEYAPVNRYATDGTDKKYCFYIDTKDVNESAQAPTDVALANQKIASLTIKGGYSNTLNDTYDASAYTTVITSRNTSAAGCDHLFYINDATQRYGAESFTEANNYGATSASTDITLVPVQFDGLTFINRNAISTADGSAIYYKDQNTSAKNVATAPKLVVDKSNFYSNEGKSVVYVGKNGGPAVIYNNVFHDNNCSPITADYTSTVNNTFAYNKGQVVLTNSKGKSEIYNSVFWKNNASAASYGAQFTIGGVASTSFKTSNATAKAQLVKNNAFTGGNTSLDYTTALAAVNFNAGLSDTNNDIMYGPNFVDPDNEEVASRSFKFATANRLLNKGVDDYFTGKTKDFSYVADVTVDIDNSPRFIEDIDLGAYEIQGQLTRVVYVDPNSLETGDGTSWMKDDEGNGGPLGIGDLQSAIDNAALYSVLNENAESYVFVKGSPATQQKHFDETITMRNGVKIYGSLPDVYESCDYEKATDPSETISTYADNLVKQRVGIASPLATKTIINGATSIAGDVTNTALLDGFVISNPSTATSPVLAAYGTAGSTFVVRNVIVADNKVSGTGVNVVEIDNALLYEALVRDNTTSANALNLGAAGYAVNVTVEGKTAGTTANALNSLINFSTAVKNSFSGYNYKVDDENLNWQLAETSTGIDKCSTTNPMAAINADLAAYINYTKDIDLLGNPRYLTNVSSKNKIDAGAFETWRVQKPVLTRTTNNFYPHEGSVVYIMEGQTLELGTNFKPGYLLVKNGASLYGNGNNVTVNYVAVEKEVKAGGSLVSMPFDMNYTSDAAVPTVANGYLTLATDASTAYSYSGNDRSDWQYSFATANSKCWKTVSGVTDANTGVLYVPATAGTYRFTAKGEGVYTETEDEEYKTVVLTQYNDSEYDSSKDKAGADFTSKENMGWNCIGLPYLVSNYNTAGSNYGDGDYNMMVPHTLWLYYDGKYKDGTAADGGAGYYSVSSWDASDWHLAEGETASIWVGEGIFTQTSTLKDDETLTFYRPTLAAASAGAKMRNARYYEGDEQEEEKEMIEEAVSDVKVYVVKNAIHVKDLAGGESIKIFSAGGQMEVSDTSESSEFVAPVRPGVHIVKVNNRTYKVIAK